MMKCYNYIKVKLFSGVCILVLLFVGHTSIQAQTTKEELDALVKDFNARIFEEKSSFEQYADSVKI